MRLANHEISWSAVKINATWSNHHISRYIRINFHDVIHNLDKHDCHKYNDIVIDIEMRHVLELGKGIAVAAADTKI